jgi:hypothetical protein
VSELCPPVSWRTGYKSGYVRIARASCFATRRPALPGDSTYSIRSLGMLEDHLFAEGSPPEVCFVRCAIRALDPGLLGIGNIGSDGEIRQWCCTRGTLHPSVRNTVPPRPRA